MDEQIALYAAGIEVPDALFWRGRIDEDEEHNFGQALNYYNAQWWRVIRTTTMR